MAKNIIYSDNEAYQLGYDDGYKDGFYQGQKKRIDTGYNFAVEKAKCAFCAVHCAHLFKGDYCWVDMDDDNCSEFNAFIKEMEDKI